MHYQFANQAKHVSVPADFDDTIERESSKLDPIMASFPDDTLLRVIVDDASGVDEIEVSLRLSLPDQLLVSRETGPLAELNSVFGKALRQLRRQVLDYKA